ADGIRVVHAGVLEAGDVAQLFGAALGQELHVLLGAEVQASGRTRLDASRFQARSHSVRAKRAFVDLFRGGIEFRDVEGAARDAELAADAVLLLEIDDAVGVLHNGAIGRASGQAAGIGAVHALVL